MIMPKGIRINVEKLKAIILGYKVAGQLAKDLRIHRQHLYRKLGGGYTVSLDDLNQICKRLNRYEKVKEEVEVMNFLYEVDLDRIPETALGRQKEEKDS